MTVWFTSDHHFNHANIIAYCSRPFASPSEMNERMIEEWNSRVEPSDTVYVVGDFFLGPIDDGLRIGQSLRGNRILVKGNHDRSTATCFRAGFSQVVGRLSLRLADGSLALLRHIPLETSALGGHDLQIHGHRHEGPRLVGPHLNVCVDLWNFRPIAEDEIVELWQSRHSSNNHPESSPGTPGEKKRSSVR